MPMPRRWVGSRVMSRPSSTTVPDAGHDEPGDHPQQRALAAARRAEQGDDLAVADVQRRAVEHGRAAEADGDVTDVEHGRSCLADRSPADIDAAGRGRR